MVIGYAAYILGVSSYYVATMYIFKIAGTDGRDLKFLGTDTKYNGTSVVDSLIFGTYYYSNSTVVTIGIHFAAVGTYIVDFGLQLQVYSTELFLPIAQEQIRVATDLIVHYGTYVEPRSRNDQTNHPLDEFFRLTLL